MMATAPKTPAIGSTMADNWFDLVAPNERDFDLEWYMKNVQLNKTGTFIVQYTAKKIFYQARDSDLHLNGNINSIDVIV